MTDNPIICRCEGVRLRQIRDIIMNWDARTLHEVKIMTRAGQGVCQGRTCGALVSLVLAQALSVAEETLVPPRSRVPVRLVPVEAIMGSDSTSPALNPGESYLPVYSNAIPQKDTQPEGPPPC